MTDWDTRPLAEVCVIKPRKAEVRARLVADSEVSFAPMDVLGIDEKFMTPMAVRALSEVSGSYTYFAEGDVLLAKITPCFENGKLGIAKGLVNGAGFGSSEFVVLRPGSKLDREFLYYYLYRPDFREVGARTMTGAVGHKRVAANFIEKLPIPIPPIAEQRRIVAILDEAFDAIATAKTNAEKNLRNTRDLFAKHLQSLFAAPQANWVASTLGVNYDVRDGTHDSPKYHESGWPLITSKNLGDEGLNFDGVKLISEADFRKINERSAVDKGDVLFAMIGTIGNPTVVEVDPDFAIKNVALFKIPKGQSGHYLRYYLSTQFVINKMQAEAKGTTQKFVGLGYLRSFPVLVPPSEDQFALVRKLDDLAVETSRLEAIYKQKLVVLDELKKTLLHQAFTGKLTAKTTDKQLEAVA